MREAAAVVDVQHDVHVGAAVADVDGAIRTDAEPLFELFDDSDLAVPGRDAGNRSHLAGVIVELELGAEDVIGRDDAGERRLNHLARCRRNHEEREPVAVDALREHVDERGDVAAQPDPAPCLFEVLAAHAAKLRVVADEICELAALMHEVAASEAGDLFFKTRGADELA